MSKKWKIAFCGLGSIGSRHLKNISEILGMRHECFTIDWIRSTDREKPEEIESLINNTYSYLDDIDDDYDIIFVTNSTFMHCDTIEKYQWKTKALFIEKPIFASDSERLNVINPNCIFYVACPVRYKKVIQHIKNNIDPTNVLSAIAICSSYLPEWRKEIDYRQCYSSIKNKGGGVSLDLIHELDYLSYLFGDVRKIYNIRDHVSSLEIDSDDISVYIAKLNQAVVQVHLDYFGRKDIRKLMIFTHEDTIEVDLLSNSISYLKSGKCIEFEETRDDFQKAELLFFFAIIDGKQKNTNDLNKAYKLLKNTFGRK
ncbi:MAG: Gfo/Idh/MocA family oxidoreductase [Lachnospiraceae bacterium]|nr:Gfo/Idh/MocA family oxidoreductase [Lachnospiraceae bacterium]